jgi:hypothetical protein
VRGLARCEESGVVTATWTTSRCYPGDTPAYLVDALDARFVPSHITFTAGR